MQRAARGGDEARIDADRGDVRHRWLRRIGDHGLGAHRPHLAGRVGPFQRRQVHHPDRELEREDLRLALDRALGELGRPRFEGDRVDGPHAGQAPATRELDRPRQRERLTHIRSLEFRSMLLRADARVELLRGLPLFELCSKRDLRRIAAIAVERELDAGAELIREGEPAGEFYVVVEGEVDVRRRGRRVARLGEGSFVGEIALLSRSPRTATVIASTPLRVLAISGRDFVALLDTLPELWLKVARTLADRVDADEASDGG